MTDTSVSVLRQYVSLRKEKSYGVAETDNPPPPRGYESEVDGWSRDVIFVEGGGRKPGRVTTQFNRRRKVERGAKGRIESPILTRGEGLRIEELLGAKTAIAVVTSGKSYKAVFEANMQGPANSYETYVARVDTGNKMRYFHYKGCVPTGFSISVEEGGNLMLGIDYDALSEEVAGAEPAAPSYPDAATTRMFIFEDCDLMIGGSAVTNFKSFSFEADLAMDTARFFLGDAAKQQPLRNGAPTFTGSMTAEFSDLAEYNRFVAGVPVAVQLVADTGIKIASTNDTEKFTLTLAAAQYGGSTPESSLDSVGMVELPFTCLSNAANKAVTIETISADSAY